MLDIDENKKPAVNNAMMGGNKPGLPFLDQLKARALGNNKSIADSTSESSTSSSISSAESSARPLNPFAAASASSGLSFLDQIKARRKDTAAAVDNNNSDNKQVVDAETSSSAPSISLPARNLFSGSATSGGMSFLEQIKSRRKDE